MNFKDLTEEIINQARVIYTDKNKTWDDRMNELVQLFGNLVQPVFGWCKVVFIKKTFGEICELIKTTFESDIGNSFIRN